MAVLVSKYNSNNSMIITQQTVYKRTIKNITLMLCWYTDVAPHTMEQQTVQWQTFSPINSQVLVNCLTFLL